MPAELEAVSLLRHPVAPFVVAAAVLPFCAARLRPIVCLAAPLAGLALLGSLEVGATASISLLSHEWTLLRVTELGRVFSLAFAAYGAICAVYAWTERGAGRKLASLALAAGGVGVPLAGDLLSLYFFWEWLTVASVFVVWQGNTDRALAAGMRYLYFHLAGGMCFLAGVLLHLAEGGGLEPMAIESVASWLILIGILSNAAVPPLHAWLSDAYPEASVFGTVFLAAFTTKSAVYVLELLFPGVELLVWLGAIMALYGVVFAVIENDIRRLLAYHIVSQVGYMVCGAGLGVLGTKEGELALNGAAAHAFCHIFYKGLLLMSAGAVVHAAGTGKLSDLGGLARPLRWTLVLCLIGGLSISGAPLFNGFVSKSMVVYASGESGRLGIELMLKVASVGTFLSTTLKLPYFAFFHGPGTARPQRPVPRSMMVAMAVTALLCVGTGVAPGLLYPLLPHAKAAAAYHPYTAGHVIGAIELLLGTALGFWLLRKKLGAKPAVTLDVDRLYRGPADWLLHAGGAAVVAVQDGAARATSSAVAAIHAGLDRGRGRPAATQVGPHVAILAAAVAVIAYLTLALA